CVRARVCVWDCLRKRSSAAGKQMPKLSDKKLCADSECSYPILIARALQDYYPGDCRFISIRQGQLVYVYAMLKDRGNLFWAGSVQDSYYGQQEARIGHFPSSVVEETHALMPATTEVKTTAWQRYCVASKCLIEVVHLSLKLLLPV
uniref:MIA SH3 domain containing n=1 Tax=Amphilophus citrinellus TaxID=61819 RepID=A0A3Q0R4K6_AMPCI